MSGSSESDCANGLDDDGDALVDVTTVIVLLMPPVKQRPSVVTAKTTTAMA